MWGHFHCPASSNMKYLVFTGLLQFYPDCLMMLMSTNCLLMCKIPILTHIIHVVYVTNCFTVYSHCAINGKGQFTPGRKRKRIHNVNLEWFKTVDAFTLGQKRKRKFTFTAAVFAGKHRYTKNVVV